MKIEDKALVIDLLTDLKPQASKAEQKRIEEALLLLKDNGKFRRLQKLATHQTQVLKNQFTI